MLSKHLKTIFKTISTKFFISIFNNFNNISTKFRFFKQFSSNFNDVYVFSNNFYSILNCISHQWKDFINKSILLIRIFFQNNDHKSSRQFPTHLLHHIGNNTNNRKMVGKREENRPLKLHRVLLALIKVNNDYYWSNEHNKIAFGSTNNTTGSRITLQIRQRSVVEKSGN